MQSRLRAAIQVRQEHGMGREDETVLVGSARQVRQEAADHQREAAGQERLGRVDETKRHEATVQTSNQADRGHHKDHQAQKNDSSSTRQRQEAHDHEEE